MGLVTFGAMGEEEKQHDESNDVEDARDERDESADADNAPDERDESANAENAPDESDASDGAEDLSGTTAPSIGPNTTFEREDPEERLARHEQSTEDAMGLDKRREVIGGSYGPSFGKQATLYGGVLAILALIVIGFILLAGKLDQPPDTVQDKAPWATEPDAGQEPPTTLQ
jgi:hypothetical protein